MISKDIYEKVLSELESFYCRTPNRMSFYQALKKTLTGEECRLWLVFPKHTEEPCTKQKLREQAPEDIDFERAFDGLEGKAFLKRWDVKNGEERYVRNYIFKIMLAYSIYGTENPMTVATRDWFNAIREGGSNHFILETPEYRTIPHEGVLTGDSTFGSIPMNIEIPDTREVVTFDYVTEMLKGRKMILLIDCFCRSNKSALNIRECNHSKETCMLFDDFAKESYDLGIGRVITAYEALKIVKKCRDEGMVQNISNSMEPSILCNCCDCCCLPLASMRRNERSCGKPSRYIAAYEKEKCEGCGACVNICPMKVYHLKEGKTVGDFSKCIGCGLCASKCKNGGIHLTLREDAEKYLPDRQRLDVMFI